MSTPKLVAVFVENKVGQSALITSILAAAQVNIHWVTIANSGSFGVMKFLVDRPEAALAACQAKGLMVRLLEVLAVEVSNRPGALQRVAECLGRSGLNLENCSGCVANERAILLIETQELSEARSVLEKQALRLLTQEELLTL